MPDTLDSVSAEGCAGISATGFATGFKGWSIGGDVTVAKNMVLSATYYDTKALKGEQEENEKAKVVWTEFNVYF